MAMDAKETVANILAKAGITIDGSKPYDVKIHNEKLYSRLLRQGELGLGESYMDGWWDVDKLDELICRLLSADIRSVLRPSPALIKSAVTGYVMNRQTLSRARRNAAYHYNIGNDLYERMLDKRMIYSCGYWEKAKNIDEAQTAKLDLICRKLHLKKGMKLLDIGCGWGGFAEYAAQKYGAIVTGISPAAEQVKLARQRTKGLPVTIQQKDYRDVRGQFDRVVSIGMLEHVGAKNYPAFFVACQKLLYDDGLMLHHFIGGNRSTQSSNSWYDKYIFPGGVIPSLTQISRAVERRFIIEDVHNFGPYYDKTLLAWDNNFTKHYKEISGKYDERFYRMWRYYLLSSAGAFRARHLQLWQVVMRKIGPSDIYQAVR